MNSNEDIEELVNKGSELTQSQRDRNEIIESRSLNILSVFKTQLDQLAEQDEITRLVFEKLKQKIKNEDPNDPIFFEDLLKATAILSKNKNEFMSIFANIATILHKMEKGGEEESEIGNDNDLTKEEMQKMKKVLPLLEKISNSEF